LGKKLFFFARKTLAKICEIIYNYIISFIKEIKEVI